MEGSNAIGDESGVAVARTGGIEKRGWKAGGRWWGVRARIRQSGRGGSKTGMARIANRHTCVR